MMEVTVSRAVAETAASPKFVLEVLRDSHRHQCAYDPEADPSAQLSFDSTVAHWRDVCDLVGTKGLGPALNEIWEIAIPPHAWEAALEPPKARTLRDVCDLIASARPESPGPEAGYLGASSRSAAVFLAVRSLLLRAGADPATIQPSAPIADMARRFPHIFLGAISRLAPGRLPTVTIRTPIYFVALTMFLVGLVSAAVFDRRYPSLGLAAALVAVLGVAGTWIASRFLGPAEVRFGTIATFRDLAEVIAGEREP